MRHRTALRSLDLEGPPLYLVQAGNKRTIRWWENWAKVIATMLAGNPAAHVILLGVPAEAALNDRIVQLAGSARVHNAATALPMARLLALQERASAMASVDTGNVDAVCAAWLRVMGSRGTTLSEQRASVSPGRTWR